jgi:hypothetical protein
MFTNNFLFGLFFAKILFYILFSGGKGCPSGGCSPCGPEISNAKNF